MKKGIKFYAPCWAIALAVFNAITFAVPITVNVNKFTPSFWIGYAFITLMFIAQLACSILFFKQDSKEKRFLNIPIISLSYTALLVSMIVGAVAMAAMVVSCMVFSGFLSAPGLAACSHLPTAARPIQFHCTTKCCGMVLFFQPIPGKRLKIRSFLTQKRDFPSQHGKPLFTGN